ncbi:CBS domain-containing protein [Desulfobacula sp.]|uniref:CBS domain-containing protein n=1 Tax=Desulfobacula sp. TaxID=2593537 RepID=UPI0026331C04|nr:CBS domain-containing protein [Desulfobacula sp.]
MIPETTTYKQLIRKFVEYNAVAASGIIESLENKEAAKVLEGLSSDLAIRVIRNLQINFLATLLENVSDDFLQKVIPKIAPQLLTAIFMNVSAESRTRFKQHINAAIETQIRDLLEYPEGSVGRVVSTDFLSFDKSLTAKETISKIRSLSKKRLPVSYGYVVDDQKSLIGVLNMRDLMLADAKDTLESIMRKDVFSLHCFTDIKDAANELAKRKYFAAPVVDSENCMIGIIKAESLLKGVQEGSSRDIQKMFGSGMGTLTLALSSGWVCFLT